MCLAQSGPGCVLCVLALPKPTVSGGSVIPTVTSEEMEAQRALIFTTFLWGGGVFTAAGERQNPEPSYLTPKPSP